MQAPKGFGKTYFSLAAIQAYASAVSMLKNFTRIQWICRTHPIHTYSTISPPKSVLSSSITIIIQGHSCLNTPSHWLYPQHLLPH